MAVPVEIEPIRNPVKYIAELFKSDAWNPQLATAPNNIIRSKNIYAFSIAPLITVESDSSNYWIDIFDGSFDNPYGYGLQVFMDEFLKQVFSESSLISTENSYYVDDDVNYIAYMNLPKKPWQYVPEYATLYGNPDGIFASAPKNENNLSDLKYGTSKVETRLKIPSLNNKLSDPISGIIIYNSFNINIDNSDGKFDGFDILEYFNTPLLISKTSENITDITDFNRIRTGLVSDIQVSFNSFSIEAKDELYTLNTDFCNKFLLLDYPNIDESNINNDIPVGWGDLVKIGLIQVDKDIADPSTWIDYIALDPDYITAVSDVYDSDGNSLTYSFNSTSGIIRTTEADGDGEVIEAETADVSGFVDNSIGEIIVKSMVDNENLPYISSVWDISETDDYINLSSNINFYFTGGTTRDLIESALTNDIAFLIQKNNGLLSIRQWGQSYNKWYIPSWLITKKPTKNFKDAYKYFLSTIKIQYLKNYLNDIYERTFLDDSMETEIFGKYKKSFTAIFETDIATIEEVEKLSDRLLERFSEIRETLNIGLGVDTFNIDLLDTIQIENTVNDRNFSQYSNWIVKEADPGQDVLTIEGLNISYVLTFNGDDASLNDSLWSVLS